MGFISSRMLSRTAFRQFSCHYNYMDVMNSQQRFSSSRNAKQTKNEVNPYSSTDLTSDVLISSVRQELAKRISLLAKSQEAFVSACKSAEEFTGETINTLNSDLNSMETKWRDLITQLSHDYQEKQFEFDIQFKTKQETLTMKFLDENGMTAIKSTELSELRNELSTIQKELDGRFNKYKDEVDEAYKLKEKSILHIASLQSRAELSEWKAKCEQQTHEIKSLHSVIDTLKKELEAARENVRHVAEASKSPGISQTISK